MESNLSDILILVWWYVSVSPVSSMLSRALLIECSSTRFLVKAAFYCRSSLLGFRGVWIMQIQVI
jgi:hypothetical protein